MPWQRRVVDVATEIQGPDDPDPGALAYRNVIVTIPRQAGKTTLALSMMVWRALTMPNARIVYTAQDGQAARKKWRDDQLPVLDASPFASMYEVRLSNGDESIRWANGSLHEVLSPTERAGHGRQIDLAVVDEAFSFADHRLDQGFGPAMITRREPQFWVVSTAGTADSIYLRSKVLAGRDAVRDGSNSGLAYFEWSAEDGADPADPETWWSCHPALGFQIRESAILGEYQKMVENPAEFERAYLNRWTLQALRSTIPESAWTAACSDEAVVADEGATFALDVSVDRSTASIAAADGQCVNLVDRRAGTDWVLPRCIQLWDRWQPKAFVIDDRGPGSAFISDLEAAGVRVVTAGAGDMASACGRFYDAVVNRQLRHLGQPDLTTAVLGAATRKLIDAWAWSRSSSQVDISPLVAATLAHFGAATVSEAEEESVPTPFALSL